MQFVYNDQTLGVSASDVEAYTTEDGWYVRKHADGYVEMFLEEFFQVSSYDKFSGGQSVDFRTESIPLPVPMVERYSMQTHLSHNPTGALFFVGNRFDDSNPLLELPGIFSINTSYTGNIVAGEFGVSTVVTGRWK